jgi:hypothetical protein
MWLVLALACVRSGDPDPVDTDPGAEPDPPGVVPVRPLIPPVAWVEDTGVDVPPPLWTRVALPDAPMPDYVDIVGSGLVVADLDGDDLLDVFLPGPDRSWLYRQTAPRVFEDITATALPGIDLTNAGAGSAVDYDADGDLDLLSVGYMASTVLLRNDGGVFTDVSAASGLAGPAWPGTGSCWGDLDHDGDLELFLARYYDRRVGGLAGRPLDFNQLYRNEGDGTFVEINDQLPPVVRDGPTFTCGWHDLNDDGWLD